MSVTEILWMVLAGIGCAAVYLWYSRRFLGKFVRKLIEIDASSPETAVSPELIHCRLTPFLRMALREGGALYETVLRVSEQEERYYIDPKKLAVTKAKYRDEKTNLPFLLLILCLLMIFGLLFTFLYPKLADVLQAL